MSTSLKVVRSAAECCAETRRSAILWRRGVSFFRVWRSPDGAAGWGAAGAGGGGGRALGARGEHVALRHAAGLAGPGDIGRVDPGLLGDPSDGGGLDGGGRLRGLGLGGALGRSGGLGSRGGCGCGCRGRPRGGRGAALNRGDDLADLDLDAGVDLERDGSGGLGRALGRDLVRLELEEGLVLLHHVAVLHVPFGEDTAADRLAHGRDFYFEGHD
jgi:hypothetical protein